MTEILNCLLRLPRKGKCNKVSFLKTQQNGLQRDFKPRPCQSESRKEVIVIVFCW